MDSRVPAPSSEMMRNRPASVSDVGSVLLSRKIAELTLPIAVAQHRGVKYVEDAIALRCCCQFPHHRHQRRQCPGADRRDSSSLVAAEFRVESGSIWVLDRGLSRTDIGVKRVVHSGCWIAV